MTPSNETKNPLIKPTIGRKVWFFPNGLSSTSAGAVEVFDDKQALDATIVCVWGDRMVNLSVTDHGGRVHSVRSCALRQAGDAPQGAYYCEWMPYQAGQAKAQSIAQQHATPAETVGVGLKFGSAIEALKAGHCVARAGWNGKGMWIALTPGSQFPAEHSKPGHAAYHLAQQQPGDPIRLCGHIDMKAADGSLVIGWLASQADMLAEDWLIVK